MIKQNIKIYGFLHVYMVNNWRDIVEEQISKMKNSGLFDKVEKVFVGLVGKEKFKFCDKKLDILYQIDKPDLYEALTMRFLHYFSMIFDGYVFYIHTKGVSRNSPPHQASWRRLMEYYTIENYLFCLEELVNNDIVGINWHLGEGFQNASFKKAEGISVTPHFSGNFWWATTDYIRKLPSLYPLKSKFECEFWIGKENPKVAELWHTGIHHHKQVYSPTNYVDKKSVSYYKGGIKI